MDRSSNFTVRQSLTPSKLQQSTEKPDLQPIYDPNFQLSSQIAILEYFNSKNLSNKLPSNSLLSNFSQSFLTIADFLFRKIDSNFQQTLQELIQNIPALFEVIGCPVAISKNFSSQLDNPQYRLQFLAALFWLTELVKNTCQDQLQNLKLQNQDELLNKLSLKTYMIFLKGEDFSIQLEALSQELQRKTEQTCKETKQLKVAIVEFKEEIEILKCKRINPRLLDRGIDLLRLQNSRLDNLQQLEQKIDNLKVVRKNLAFQYQEKKQIEKIKIDQLEQLKEMIDKQEYSMDDIEKKTRKNEQCINQIQKEKEEITEKLRELKQDIKQKVGQIQNMADNCQLLANKLQIFPKGYSFSLKKDLIFQFQHQNTDFSEQNSLYSQNIPDKIQFAYDVYYKQLEYKLLSVKEKHSQNQQQYQSNCQICQTLQKKQTEIDQNLRFIKGLSLQGLEIVKEAKSKLLKYLKQENLLMRDKSQMLTIKMNKMLDKKNMLKQNLEQKQYFFKKEQANIKQNIFELTEMIRIHQERILFFLRDAAKYTKSQYNILQNPE